MPDTDYEELIGSLNDFFPELGGAPPAIAPGVPQSAPEESEAVVTDFAPPQPPPGVVQPPEETEESTLTADFTQPSAVTPAAPTRVVHLDDAEDEGGDVVQTFELQREVPDITKPWMKYHKFTRVETVDKVREIVDAAIAHGRCALDTETEGLDTRIFYDAEGKPRTKHQIVGYCLSVDGTEGFYIPVRHNPEDGGPNLNVPVVEVEAEIRRLCSAAQPKPAPGAVEKDPLGFREFAEPPKVVIYFWNAKFDQEMLYPVVGIDWWHPESFEDGMLACFCDYSADKALSLKHKAPEWLRDQDEIPNPYSMIELKELFPLRGQQIRFATLSPDEPGVVKYAGSDAICTYLLCEPPRKHEKHRKDYIKLARERYSFTYRLEKQCIQAVRVMERYRCKVDRDKALELLEVHQVEFARLLKEIQNFAKTKGYNLDPSSPKQLSDFLFTDNQGCLNITPKPEINEASGQYKTDGETLEGMVAGNPHAPPILRWIVDYRGEEKMIGTYLEHLVANPDAKTNELRFGFKETGAGTGRFSAPAGEPEQGFSGIPIHGIPGESVMRKLFLARDGYTFVKCDYAGQELRIAANVSGEPVWIKEFLEGDGDLHTITAKAFFNKDVVSKDERKMGKIANFALIYGGGPQAIIRATGCDKVEASRRKQAFDKAVPVFAGWIKAQQKVVKESLGVWTPFKRWLAIPDARHEDRKIQAACERYAVNYPIQGSGADIMKISMVTLHKEFHKRGWLRSDVSTGYVGDDSVRMLLTVHDEIVFEIRHHRVTEAIPIIVEIMERPAKMATSKWRIPLITEPLVGPNWGTGYKCERFVEGKTKKHEGDVLINGFLYGTIRESDLGKDSAGIGEEEHSKTDKKIKIRAVDPAWLRGLSMDGMVPVSIPIPPKAEPDRTETPAAPKTEKAAPKVFGRVVTVKIQRLTPETVNHVRHACLECLDKKAGATLRLTDQVGTALIDPSLGIRIDPTKFVEYLDKNYNLGDSTFHEEN
jgi:DNA polymerase I-like protein with 3'-5' exonuclease and polymerase domains